MRKLFVVLLPLLMACSSRESAANQTADSSDNLAPLSAAQTASGEAATVAGVSQELTISAPELTAKSGENICVDVQVNGFEKLLSMQYTITWNKNVLGFTEIKNFNLPYLDQNDFGLHITQDGMLTCAWIDESLKGATVADGASIYQVCFTVKGKPGEQSYFKFTDRPTSIEVVNLREKVIPLQKKAGNVKVQ